MGRRLDCWCVYWIELRIFKEIYAFKIDSAELMLPYITPICVRASKSIVHENDRIRSWDVMLSERSSLVLNEIKKVCLESWYKNLKDLDKVRLERYVSSSGATSAYEFFIGVIDKSVKDKNYEFTAFLCQSANKLTDISDYQRFKVNEIFIESCAEVGKYDDLKATCEINFKLFEKVKTNILETNNGAYPSKLNFRNKYIDVVVGIDLNYDLGLKMLEKYKEMGLLTEEEFRFRHESLNAHRLQRIFDGVYAYRPVKKDF